MEQKTARGFGESSYEETVVKTHSCLEQDKQNLFTGGAAFGRDLFKLLSDEQYANMNCIDSLNELQFYGAPFDSAFGSYFSISVKKCIDKFHCKSTEEIDDFIENNELSILIAYNQATYDPEEYGEGTIRREVSFDPLHLKKGEFKEKIYGIQ